MIDFVNQAIRDFGRNIGFQDLKIDGKNSLKLIIGENILISFTYLDNLPIREIIISKTREIQYLSLEKIKRLLEYAHFEITPQLSFQNSIIENKLISSVRILERNFNLNTIEQAISFLEEFNPET